MNCFGAAEVGLIRVWGVKTVRSIPWGLLLLLGRSHSRTQSKLSQKGWFPGHLYKHWPFSKLLSNCELADWSPTLLRCVPDSLFILEKSHAIKGFDYPYTHLSSVTVWDPLTPLRRAISMLQKDWSISTTQEGLREWNRRQRRGLQGHLSKSGPELRKMQ